MNDSTPVFPVLHYIPEFAQTLSIESVMSFNHLILCCLLLLPSIFPESGSFPVSWFFTSSCQSIGALASVLPMNIQGWFPSELTALISLMSKGLLRVFSSTTVQKHQFFKDTQPSLWSNSLDLAYAKMFTLGCFFFFFLPYQTRVDLPLMPYTGQYLNSHCHLPG